MLFSARALAQHSQGRGFDAQDREKEKQKKRTPGSSFSISPQAHPKTKPQEHNEERPSASQKDSPCKKPSPAGTLTLNFTASRTIRKKKICCLNHTVVDILFCCPNADGYNELYQYIKVIIIIITVTTQPLSLCTSLAIQMLDFNLELFCASGESDTYIQNSPIYTILFNDFSIVFWII